MLRRSCKALGHTRCARKLGVFTGAPVRLPSPRRPEPEQGNETEPFALGPGEQHLVDARCLRKNVTLILNIPSDATGHRVMVRSRAHDCPFNQLRPASFVSASFASRSVPGLTYEIGNV